MYTKKKTNIAVVGSTGSVGTQVLKVISSNINKFNIKLLICNRNLKKILSQIKTFSPNFVYIKNSLIRSKLKKKKFKKTLILDSIKEYSNKLDKVFLCSPGISGLEYAIYFTKFSKELLIANKESIVCGGRILINLAKKNNCKIFSIDSEHYSISQILTKANLINLDKIYLTASGGPFLNTKNFKRAKFKSVIAHPKWKMGKKISIDSATLVNKFLELIEAHVLFEIPINKIKIKIHCQSLVHAVVVYKDGLIKMIMHDTTMIIPIRNSLFNNKYFKQKKNFFHKKQDIQINFNEQQLLRFKIVKTGYKILSLGHTAWILFNFFNDYFVQKFINREIYFYQIVDNLTKLFKNKSILLFCRKNKVKKISDIYNVLNYGNKILKANGL